MTKRTQWVRVIVLVGETTEGNRNRSDTHAIREITESLARMDNVNYGLAVFDPVTGHRIRRVELNQLGESSPEHKKLMDEELGVDSEEVVAS